MPTDPATPGFAFPAHLRMKSPGEFRAVYDLKKSSADAVLVVYAGPNNLAHPRLGVSVSKRVGRAPTRNRYKRLFREAFRLVRADLPAGVDLILIPRPQNGEPTLTQVKGSLVRLAKQAAKKLTKPAEGASP